MAFSIFLWYNLFIPTSTYLKGQSMNIAILIDAENIDPVYAKQIFACAESKGTIVVREIYGAGIALNEWSNAILQYVLHTNMTLKPSKFKNSSDIALVIGAMDLLVERATHGLTIDAVIIASSDSDYSTLAIRLRSSGIDVIGMGKEGHINPSWPMACSEFIVFTPMDEIRQESQPQPQSVPPAHRVNNPAPTHDKVRSTGCGQTRYKHIDRVALIREFISDQLSKNDGQMASATLFNLLKELPDYLYDQQRSKRTPVDYLSRQYGDLLKFQKNSDGALWVYSRLADAAAAAGTEDGSVAPQETAPQQETRRDAENPTFPLIEFLCDAGVDETAALKISSAYVKCSDMRAVYNVLRKTFKNEAGKTYYKLVKQYREGQDKRLPHNWQGGRTQDPAGDNFA